MAWHVAARTDEVAEGEVLGVVVDGEPVALFKVDGKVYATSNVCTHEFALLSDGFVDGDCIECPLHQARFHIETGKVRAAPATEDIRTFPAKIDGNHVLVELPEI